jgi:hypothetical protein
MEESSTSRRLSRRTVAKGAAWTVPAVAVAATAPSAAASPFVPPPPVFNFAAGCATVGNGAGGCNGVRFTPQIPFFIRNTTNETLQFQITGTKFWISGQEPANFSQNQQIWTNNGSQTGCGPRIQTIGCDGLVSVTLTPGQCANLWVVSPELDNASSFNTVIQYRWVTPGNTPAQPGDCAVVVPPTEARPTSIISPNNCSGAAYTLTPCPAP